MDRFANRWPWLLAIAAAVMVAGCGEDARPRVVDPLLLPYVEEFESAAGFPVGSSVVYGALSGFTTGTCVYGEGFVIIGESLKNWKSETDVMLVVFHELAHCEIGRIEHEDFGDLGDGCYVSIMSPTPPDSDCFTAHRDYYLEELFTGY